jgi:hypothetical protein
MPEEAKPQAEQPDEIVVEVQGYGNKPPKPQLSDEEVEKMDQLPPGDEIGRYAQDAQKRIKAQHVVNQEWRRRVNQANRDVAAATSLAQQLYQENQQLKTDRGRNEQALVEQAFQRSEAQLAQAKQRFLAARAAGDASQELAAQEEIARCAAESHNLRLLRPAPPAQGQQQQPQPQQSQPQQQPPPQLQPQPEVEEGTRRWLQSNSWWNQPGEEERTNFARGVALALEKQGITATSNPKEYWGTVDRRLREVYPARFGVEQPEKPTTNGSRPVAVAGATRTNGAEPKPQRGSRHVSLSESQVKLARSLGLTNEQYAIQLVRDEQLPEGSYHDVATK